MKEPTKESIETTENFMKAMEEYYNNKQNTVQDQPKSRLVHAADGVLIEITRDPPKEGELWIEIDEKDFYSKYSLMYNFLKVIDGKLVNTKKDRNIIKNKLEPGDTWQANKENRLIVGDPNGDNEGWSRKAD